MGTGYLGGRGEERPRKRWAGPGLTVPSWASWMPPSHPQLLSVPEDLTIHSHLPYYPNPELHLLPHRHRHYPPLEKDGGSIGYSGYK